MVSNHRECMPVLEESKIWTRSGLCIVGSTGKTAVDWKSKQLDIIRHLSNPSRYVMPRYTHANAAGKFPCSRRPCSSLRPMRLTEKSGKAQSKCLNRLHSQLNSAHRGSSATLQSEIWKFQNLKCTLIERLTTARQLPRTGHSMVACPSEATASSDRRPLTGMLIAGLLTLGEEARVAWCYQVLSVNSN